MELNLNIYKKNTDGKYVIDKTYTTETVDIMFGTAEDLIGLLDNLDLNNETQLINVVTKGFTHLKPFLKDIFIGLTDEELRNTKLKELIPLFVQIFKYLFKEIGMTSNGKN